MAANTRRDFRVGHVVVVAVGCFVWLQITSLNYLGGRKMDRLGSVYPSAPLIQAFMSVFWGWWGVSVALWKGRGLK